MIYIFAQNISVQRISYNTHIKIIITTTKIIRTSSNHRSTCLELLVGRGFINEASTATLANVIEGDFSFI
jgi:hypothetical protein